MRRLLGLGDNTTDLYLSQGMLYPGGNALNVAALTARLQRPASYLGCVGLDTGGHHLLASLRTEGVDITHCLQLPGSTSWSKIEHDGQDRKFVGFDHGVQAQWVLSGDVPSYIADHQIVHSSLYSELGDRLPAIRASAHLLSFDFSSDFKPHDLEQIAPSLDVAFCSDSQADDHNVAALAAMVQNFGCPLVVVTRGERGAVALSDGQLFTQPSLPAHVVDTLGAGDAFIAGFLNAWLDQADIGQALQAAARLAAQNCAEYGAFGRGVPLPAALVQSSSETRSS
ncbi:PfkB family carbohydrate kinase [Deinococcus humi]|uniref:Fructoselysine 6-kinase n=1 Tax=Deinococcus humi TaxID=662880 RepID=A0A7W8NGL6_9DEIO|nr:PfkB family carbohydrate kinase [Deinococcus humi]MBB5363928.1 fructoselysine 6-kinase [Deinococcus humi]GGO40574.1 fructosamine kinase FrlD [Deinococcus humi]